MIGLVTDALSAQEVRQRAISLLIAEPRTQFESLIQAIERPIGRSLSPGEFEVLFETIQAFLASGILMQATDRHNVGWPWLAVTTRGADILSQNGPPVYDYDGYMSQLHERVPDLDEVVESFLSESLRAYYMHCHLAAVTMLGCASERAVRLLFNAYIGAIDDLEKRDRVAQRLNGRDISTAFAKFRESFAATKKQIKEPDVLRDFDAKVEGVFHFVRIIRNAVVHADSLPSTPDALVYGSLQQFSVYIEAIFSAINYLNANSISI